MSNCPRRAIIDDVTSANIDEAIKSNLLDLFEHAMKSISTTLAREARFETKDFGSAKDRGCHGFALIVSRARSDSRDAWFGAFQRGDQRLDVVGHLEQLGRSVDAVRPSLTAPITPRRQIEAGPTASVRGGTSSRKPCPPASA